MTVILRSKTRWWLALGLSLATTVLRAEETTAQSAIYSTRDCARCHFPAGEDRGMQASDPDARATFCQEEEAEIWERDDKHRQSLYLMLTALDEHGKPLVDGILSFKVETVLSFQMSTRRIRAKG